MKTVFGVIGLGRFGFHVAKTLAEGGAEVIAIDSDPERVRAVSEFVTRSYVADALDEKALEEAGLFNVDVAVLSIGQRVEASILVAVLLINRGVREIVAKAVNPLHGEVLKRIGVKRVIYPEKEVAQRLARSLLIRGVLAEIPFAEGYSIFEVEAPSWVKGKTLGELDLRRKLGVNVLAIKRGDRILVNPSAQESISEGDLILVLSSEEDLKRFLKGR